MTLYKDRHVAYLRKGLFAPAGVSRVRTRFHFTQISARQPLTDRLLVSLSHKGTIRCPSMGCVLVSVWTLAFGRSTKR